MRIVVGYAAGGGVDITARLIGAWLADRLGQQFIIENRPGASTNIATESVVRSDPDGYTLLLVNAANAINASVFDRLSFDFIRDMSAAGGIMRVAFVIVVNPSLPVTTVPELIAYAKANPLKLNAGTGGQEGRTRRLPSTSRWRPASRCSMYRTAGWRPRLSICSAGQVQLVFATVPSAIEYIKAGKLRPLAVTTAAPSDALPGVPTLGSFLPGFEFEPVVRPRRAQGYAPRRRREAQRGDQCGACRSQNEGADCRPRRHADADDARRIRQVYRCRNHEMGQGGPIRRHQDEMTPALPAPPNVVIPDERSESRDL